MAQYFYDQQIRRFVLQFIRYFSQYQVEYGRDANNNPIYLTVPVRYADTNRAVSSILTNNSENSLRNVPLMVAYIDALKYERDRIQDPTFTEKRTIRERALDLNTGEYKTYQKNMFTVERIMPVPYKLTMKLDIVTSSIEQKLQLLEQIGVMFNPSMEIQSTDSYLDWTSLSVLTLTDINFTSRTIPVGADDPIDVATLTFDIPIWLSPPAKIKKLNAVTGVVASIFDAHGNLAQAIEDQYELLGKRQWFTPSGYNAIVANGQVILSKQPKSGTNTDLDIPEPVNTPVPWRGVVNYIGEMTNGVSQMAFVNEDTGNVVIGTISYHPTDESIMLFTVDSSTIPSNTLTALNNIIDPQKVAPGKGLPAAAAGQRYLLVNSNIGNAANSANNNPIAWRNANNSPVLASANDIIQYNGSTWSVVFDSSSANENTVEYVTNSYTGIQYKWLSGKWQKSWEGLYLEGLWLIII